MKHATNCKFCKRPITVTVDDYYAEMGDPYKLLAKASCNTCADVRQLRRVLEDRISRQATAFAAMHRPSEAAKGLARKNLTRLCEAYAKMIARWHRTEGMAFDEEVVNTMLDRPDKWAECLSGLWRMFKQWQRDKGQETESMLL